METLMVFSGREAALKSIEVQNAFVSYLRLLYEFHETTLVAKRENTDDQDQNSILINSTIMQIEDGQKYMNRLLKDQQEVRKWTDEAYERYKAALEDLTSVWYIFTKIIVS